MSLPKPEMTIPSSCSSCNKWSTRGGGYDSVAWSACNTPGKNVLVPEPRFAGGSGYLSLTALQDALHKNYTKSTGQCSSKFTGYDSDDKSCMACNDYVTSTENYQGLPWTRPTAYMQLNRTWSSQKPFEL
jgi:hypothetical protein